MFLTISQIKELTKKKYASAQARQLDYMGITYTKRLDGSLVVSVSLVEKVLGLNLIDRIKPIKEPNWDALNDAKTTQ